MTGALWMWPAVSVVVAVVSGQVLAAASLPAGGVRRLLWPGDVGALSTLLQVVATATITATTLTFSVTVVALQLASQQFSPRLLREFTRDRVTKAVLSVLLGTFAFCLTVLRDLRTGDEPPALAGFAVALLALVSLCALLGFITHIVRILRIDSMMLAVHDESRRAIETFYPGHDDPGPRSPGPGSRPPGEGLLVAADRGGFVRRVDVAGLVEGATRAGAFVELLVRPGDHVVDGTPLAVSWQSSGGAPDDPDAVARVVRTNLHLGYERTLEQDAAFGFRQLEDIAVKALSPGINDPVTAAHAIGHMSELAVRLLGCRLGATVHEDAEGRPRAVVPDRDLAYYLDLACGQVRRYGAREPTVLAALLRLLRDAATASRDDRQRAVIAAEADAVVAAADPGLDRQELTVVHDLRGRVDAALRGDTLAAYADRAGETRSI